MRILHVDGGKEWRGGQKQVFLLHEGLLKLGIESFLVCNKEGELYEQVHPKLSNCLGWNFTGKRSSKTKKDLKSIIDHVKPDIIHYHDSLSINYTSVGDALKVATRRVSYPIKWLSRLTKYKNIDLHVGVSQTITNYMSKYFPNCKTRHSSIDLNYFKNSQSLNQFKNKSEYNILFVGAYSKQKGIPVLLDAFSKLIKQDTKATLHLCGSGELQGLIDETITKYDLQESIIQYGHQKDIAPFYHEADVVIVPSVDGEGSSGTIKEGIASLKTVIASDIEPNKELVEDGKTGFLFESNNSNSLLKLLSKRPTIPTNVLEKYREQFSSQMMIDKYVEFYRELLS